MKIRKFTFVRDAREGVAFRIFGALLHRTFGDFVDQLLFVATAKEHMPNSVLNVYYRPDREYKAKLVSLVPQIDRAWPMPDGVPLDFFDTAHGSPDRAPREWLNSATNQTDLLLTPTMCSFGKLCAFPNLALFRIPDAPFWEDQLAKRVNDNWFVVVHYREPNYGHRGPDALRDFDPKDALPIYDAILRAGGNVVRLGHPGMTPLPDKEGLVDLSDADVVLQACAVSKARFFLELSASGPISLALPFGIPALRCNQPLIGRTFEDMTLSMPKRVFDSDGVDRTLEVVESGGFNRLGYDDESELTLRSNTTEQILEGLQVMLSRIKGDDGWRTHPTRPADRRVQQPDSAIQLPLSNDLGVHLIL
jgi:putative glycosyltransferase (TIGR04372 family)